MGSRATCSPSVSPASTAWASGRARPSRTWRNWTCPSVADHIDPGDLGAVDHRRLGDHQFAALPGDEAGLDEHPREQGLAGVARQVQAHLEGVGAQVGEGEDGDPPGLDHAAVGEVDAGPGPAAHRRRSRSGAHRRLTRSSSRETPLITGWPGAGDLPDLDVAVGDDAGVRGADLGVGQLLLGLFQARLGRLELRPGPPWKLASAWSMAESETSFLACSPEARS